MFFDYINEQHVGIICNSMSFIKNIKISVKIKNIDSERSLKKYLKASPYYIPSKKQRKLKSFHTPENIVTLRWISGNINNKLMLYIVTPFLDEDYVIFFNVITSGYINITGVRSYEDFTLINNIIQTIFLNYTIKLQFSDIKVDSITASYKFTNYSSDIGTINLYRLYKLLIVYRNEVQCLLPFVNGQHLCYFVDHKPECFPSLNIKLYLTALRKHKAGT